MKRHEYNVGVLFKVHTQIKFKKQKNSIILRFIKCFNPFELHHSTEGGAFVNIVCLQLCCV